MAIVDQVFGRCKGEVLHFRHSFCNGILHAGGRAVQRDVGSVGSRVGGGGLKDVVALFVGDGDLIHRQPLPIVFCQRRIFALTVAVGCVCRLVDGHAAASGGRAAWSFACGSDGRAVCRILPLMRMHLQLYGLAVIQQANIIRGVIAGEILCNNPARIRRRSDIHIPLRKISSRSHADVRVLDQLPADRDLFAAGQADIVCDTASLVVALNNSIAADRHLSG